MTKATKKRTLARKPAPAGKSKAASERSKRARAKKRIEPKAASSKTKQSRAIAMLRSDDGASIAALMKTTGWQQHSVRGFLAGVVRKRLGFELESEKIDGCRIYRVVGDRKSEPAAFKGRGS